MKNFILAFVLIFTTSFVYSKTVINGHIEKKQNLKYFKPFNGFRNFNFSTPINIDDNGYFKIELEILNPYFIRFLANDVPFNLLVEPNDSIYIILTPSKSKKGNKEWFKITGNNSGAHFYFNNHFNFYPITKFDGIRRIFDSFDENNTHDFLKDIISEQNKQTFWLDSLLQQKKISEIFYEYMTKDIHGIIACEAVLILEQIGTKVRLKYKDESTISELQNSVFKLYPPTDRILRYGLYGSIYLSEYYRIQSKNKPIDNDLVICEDQKFLVLASKEEQDYLWGNAIQAVADIAPTSEDLCKASKKYIENFPNGIFSSYLLEKNFCNFSETGTKKIKIFTTSDTEFFSFLTQFYGKRIFIDVWATWCVPCKLEFQNYTSDFYDFLNTYQIETLFLSIDENSNQAKWEKEVKFFNLKGNHVLLNQNLVESLREVIFDGNSISIPRYILVNEKGKILSVDAPRPSDPKIRQIFDELLKKK